MLLPLIAAVLLGAMTSATIIRLREQMHASSDAGVEVRRIIRIITRRLFPASGNPRIMVSEFEDRSPICQICMGRIKEGSSYVRCKCNRSYHIACLSRLGYCPICQEKYEDLRPLSEGSPESFFTCPLCGAWLEPGATRCACGAIFTDEGSDFCCPSCGTRIPEGEIRCPYCGEVFESHRMVRCAFCGQLVLEEEGICSCGAILGNRCPECGAELEPDATRCPNCNSEFEFI